MSGAGVAAAVEGEADALAAGVTDATAASADGVAAGAQLAADAGVTARAATAAVVGELVRFVEPPHGLVSRDFALFALDAGLFALRAVDDSVRLFVLHGALLAGYAPELSDRQVAQLGLDGPEDAEVLVVVNPSADAPTANLLAPIVVNRHTRAAAQFVIETGEWPLRAPLGELLAG